jgi:hypothetical protein
MIPDQRILLCGRSLFFLGLAATLAELPGVEVIHQGSLTLVSTEEAPALIILECDGREHFAFLLSHTSAPLLELDVQHNRLTLINTQQIDVATMNDVVRVISQFVTT